jgi:hypothetical protein
MTWLEVSIWRGGEGFTVREFQGGNQPAESQGSHKALITSCPPAIGDGSETRARIEALRARLLARSSSNEEPKQEKSAAVAAGSGGE